MILDLSPGCPTVSVMHLAQQEAKYLKWVNNVGCHASGPVSQTMKPLTGFSIYTLDGL